MVKPFPSGASLPAVVLLALLLPAAGPAEAQVTRLDADPLRDVARAAVEANRELARVRLREDEARAGLRAATGRYLPSLSLDARYSEQSGVIDLGQFVNPAYAAINQVVGEDRFPTDLEFTLPLRHESRLRLTQPVFNGEILAGRAAARHELEGREASTDAAVRTVAAQAQVGLLRVAAAGSVRRIWEETLPLLAENERVAQRLVDAGSGTPDAVFRARAERAAAEQELAAAREQEDAVRRALNRLLARPLDAPVATVPEDLLDEPLPVDEEEAVRRALLGREELRAVRSGLQASRAGVRAARARYLPSLALALDYGFQGRDLSFGADDDFWIASVVVSWNVFSGGSDRAERAAAQARARQAELQEDDLRDGVALEARQAHQAARVARAAIATAEARLASARRSFELVRRRYEEGLAPPVEFLDARTALTSAELNRTLTLYQYAIRRVELIRAAALAPLPRPEATP